MSKSGLRIKKSRSMMVSLYTLSGLTVFLMVAFVGTLWFRSLALSGGISWQPLWPILKNSFAIHAVAMVIAFPVAFALTFLATLWNSTRWAKSINRALDMIREAPHLVYGVFFLAFLGGGKVSLILTFALIAATELTRRWIHVSRKVKVVEIETLQALGCGLPRMVFVLYIKRFIKLYLGHLFAVFCGLFVLVTPVLCFIGFSEEHQGLVSIEMFRYILDYSPTAANLALILLVMHLIKVIFDWQTSFWEAEHG